MKFFAATASLLPLVVAALPTSEPVTISSFIYRAPAGGMTVGGKRVARYMAFMASQVTCQALDVDIPGTGYVCDDPAYTFETLDPGVMDATFLIRLSHSTDRYVIPCSTALSETNLVPVQPQVVRRVPYHCYRPALNHQGPGRHCHWCPLH